MDLGREGGKRGYADQHSSWGQEARSEKITRTHTVR